MKKWRVKFALWLALLVTALCTAGCGGLDSYELPEPANVEKTAETETLNQKTDLTETGAQTGSEAVQPTSTESTKSTEGTANAQSTENAESAQSAETLEALDPDGSYTSRDDVALYLETYGRLPGNFITKKEAQALGWQSGSLEPFAPGKCIGGDKFGNYEGTLPAAKGRTYRECDIDTLGKKSRGAKRIVYSNDGLIYYTEDHYESFTLLYD